MATMRAIDIKGGTGPPEALYLTTVPKPKPGQGQALVKIHAFGLNRMDLMQRKGNYNLPPQAGPILGVEFSGIIEELGPALPSSEGDTGTDAGRKIPSFAVGDEVFGLAYGGSYAEYVASSVLMLIRKPPQLTHIQCAGIPETWLTATQSLYLVGGFDPNKHKAVLFHAGASAVSIALIQLVRYASPDVKIFITAGSAEKIALGKELGVTRGFNYHTEDWATGVLQETNGRGVDIVVDFIGRDYAKGNLEVAALDGRIVQLGTMSGKLLPEGVDISLLEQKRLRWEGSRLRSRELEYQHRLRDSFVDRVSGGREDEKDLLKGFLEGRLRVVIERVMSWKDIVEAHGVMERNESKGKIICVVD